MSQDKSLHFGCLSSSDRELCCAYCLGVFGYGEERLRIHDVLPLLMVVFSFPRWLPSGDICQTELIYSCFCLAGESYFQVESSHPTQTYKNLQSILTMLSNSVGRTHLFFFLVKCLESLVRVQNNFSVIYF